LANPDVDQDDRESLTEELAQVEKAIAAPSQPFVRNFEQETEGEEVHQQKQVHGLGLTSK